MRRAFAVWMIAACDPSREIVDAAAEVPIDAGVTDSPELDAVPDAHPHADSAIDGPQDAPGYDGTPANIVMVPCAGSAIAVTIFTSKSDYYPEAVSIQGGEIVRFQPLNPHDVVAGTFAAPEAWFTVQGNTVGCVRFDESGVFPFYCTAHPFSMTGSVTVVP